MKKFLALTMVAMTLLLSACSGSYDRGYDEGYNEGYGNGYESAIENVTEYLVPPEDFADEVGTSYDDFMGYYSLIYENVHDSLHNISYP